MKRYSLLSLAAPILAALAAPTLAHADTLTLTGKVIDFSHTTQACLRVNCPNLETVAFAGTIDIDAPTHLVTSASLTANTSYNGASYSFTNQTFPSTGCSDLSRNFSCTEDEYSEFRFAPATGTYLDFSFDSSTLGDPSGTPIFLSGHLYGSNYSGGASITPTLIGTVDPITSLTPTAATPEPSSLILLGTGILGVAGAARRRFLA